MKLDELVSQYITLRDRKSELKQHYDVKVRDLDQLLDRIEARLLETFEASGVDSVKTPAGTAYRSTRASVSVADRDSYFGWILQDPTERMVFLESRANKTAVEQFKAANDDLPPGLNWREERVVNIRRS